MQEAAAGRPRLARWPIDAPVAGAGRRTGSPAVLIGVIGAIVAAAAGLVVVAVAFGAAGRRRRRRAPALRERHRGSPTSRGRCRGGGPGARRRATSCRPRPPRSCAARGPPSCTTDGGRSTPRPGSATRSSTRSSRTGSPASERVHKPGPLEPWDAPPTHHGFKGGDLLGIVEHLDYLADLGVNALYLTPIFASASNHRYHTYDYLAVDPLLGGDDALRELLDAAHDRGMRVVLDGVFNHTGRGFWPFHHVLEAGAASPYRRWFHVDEALDSRGGRCSRIRRPGRTRRRSATRRGGACRRCRS